MADIQQTNEALIELQRHLEGLRTAAEQIDDAKKAVSTAVTVADTVRQDMAGVTKASNALLERIGTTLATIEAAKLPAVASDISGVLEQLRLTGDDSTAKLLEQVLAQVKATGSDPTAKQILQQVKANGGDSAAKLDQIIAQVRAGGSDSSMKLDQLLQQVKAGGADSTAKLDDILLQVRAADYTKTTAALVAELATASQRLRRSVLVIGVLVGIILLECSLLLLRR